MRFRKGKEKGAIFIAVLGEDGDFCNTASK